MTTVLGSTTLGATTELMAVAFADLCGFTGLSQRLSADELDQLLGRFESIVAMVTATHGGRVVKLMGDEVLLTAEDPRTIASIAIDLSRRAAADDLLPGLRVGAAFGSVLVRRGDCFGTTVNLASRIVNAAPCGQVLMDQNMYARLRDVAGIPLALYGVCDLKDFVSTPLWRVQGTQTLFRASMAESRAAL